MTETDDIKVMNRGMVVIGAVLIQLCLGAIYAWSVFTPALSANSPHVIASLYAPAEQEYSPQLGLDQEQFSALRADLKEPLARIKALNKELEAAKDSGSDARVAEVEAKLAIAEQEADAVVRGHVSPEQLAAKKYGFSKTKTSAIFSAGLAAFAVVMVLAGRLMPKIGPRKLAMAGGVVLGLGYLLAGILGGQSFVTIFILIGLVGGAGIGLAYVVPIAVGMRWFPDKKGMITGLAVAGFGFGALLWVKLAGSWGQLIFLYGLGTTFSIYGIVFLAAVVLGGIWMVFPPEGWAPAGYVAPEAKEQKAGEKPVAAAPDLTSGQMLGTVQFYLILLCFAFGASAGLMSIGLMKLFPIEALKVGGMDEARASAIAGTAMAVFFSLANGLGRILWGMVSDKLGRKTSIMLMMASQGVMVILFQWMAGVPVLLYLGAAIIGFNFGGNFALFPTVTADTFGTKHIGQNYGWVFLAYGIGGIFGPILGGRLGDLGNFPLAFTICGVLCILAAALIAGVRAPRGKAVAAEA